MIKCIVTLIFVLTILGGPLASQTLSPTEESDHWEAFVDSLFARVSESWQNQDYRGAQQYLFQLYQRDKFEDYDERWININYNLACSYSLLGNADSALKYLDESVDAGYSDYDNLLADGDLLLLRADPRFQELANSLYRRSRFWENDFLSSDFRYDLSEDERLAGLAKLWSTIKYNFVHFDRSADMSWDSLYLAFIPQVRATHTTLDYCRTLQRFTSLLRDGHTRVWAPSQLWDSLYSGVPIETRLIGNKTIVTRIDDDALHSLGLAVGDELVEIDGVPTQQYAEQRVAPYYAASTPQGSAELHFGYWLLRGAKGSSVVLSVKDFSGDQKRIELNRGKEVAAPRAVIYRHLGKEIDYVEFTSFGSDSVSSQFDALFDSISIAKGLIIDLRRNGGGDSGVGWKILSRLVNGDFETLRSSHRNYDSWHHYLGRRAADEEELNIWSGSSPALASLPVVVLCGSFTASAAEDFLVAFDYLSRGKIFGELTAGTTGNPMGIPLPGGIYGNVCINHCRYPDGAEYVGVGIRPDFVVPTTLSDIRTGRDPVLEAAVKYLNNLD